MAELTLLEKIKKSLGISHLQLDTVIQSDIDACLLDLGRVGIVNAATTDAAIIKMIDLYCKWQSDHEGNGERYGTTYERMRDAYSMYDAYNAEVV